MPKEIVYGDSLPFGTPDEPGPARSVVEVRWDREGGDFQIVTRCIDAQTGETFQPHPGIQQSGFVDESLTTTAANTVNVTWTLPPPSMLTFYDGFWVDLDRRGINQLIRNLRRARDQAFGRDE